MLSWLAILREPVSIADLLAVQVARLAHAQVLEAVDGLRRRSLVERGQPAGSFTLQSVVLEYVTGRLVEEASQEIQQGRLSLLIQHGLELAQAKEYVRQTQERVLLTPLLDFLGSVYRERAEVEEHLRELLSTLRGWEEQAQGYGPANLVALLCLLHGHLRGLDLSQLALRGVYLQGVEMQDTKLSGALMRECVFTQSFDATWGVAISKSGQYWAAASQRGEVRVWREAGQVLHRVWQAHTDFVIALACSPNERTLASASFDGSVKLWDVERRALLWSGQHTKSTLCLAFSPDGCQLASGRPRAVLRGHRWSVSGVAWSPDGRLLASAGWDHAIRLWEPTTGTCVQILRALDDPETVLFGVAWSPDGERLASGTVLQGVLVWDGMVHSPCWVRYRLPTGIRRVAWSPAGTRLVGGGDDGHVYVWDASDGTLLQRLAGHQGVVTSVAWSPDGTRLASGSVSQGEGGGKLLVWDAHNGEDVRTLTGHPGGVSALTWGPNGQMLISGGRDGKVRWWEVQSGQCVHAEEGHQETVHSLKVSPDGRRLASCGDDGAIVLWDLERGQLLRTLRRDRPYERLNITGIRGLSDAQKASLCALGAFEATSRDE